MRRTVFSAVLALAVIPGVHAQDFEGVCADLVAGQKYIEVFLTCEPASANEAGRKAYGEAPWKRKIAALLACVKTGKPGVESRLRDGLQLCYDETSP
jgi:hypothetical protein